MKTNQQKYHEDLITSLDIIIAVLCFGFDFYWWVKALAVASAVAQFAYTCVIWYKAEKAKRKNTTCEYDEAIAALLAERARLRGIIARNARQRMASDDDTKTYITAQDIKDSVKILHEEIDAEDAAKQEGEK